MLKSHQLLLKYRHDTRYTFCDLQVCYVDRGALADMSCVNGSEIRALEAYYFDVASEHGNKYIPYHRIRKIAYAGETIWER
jgi:uncharacterized protein (UPF0248 family)